MNGYIITPISQPPGFMHAQYCEAQYYIYTYRGGVRSTRGLGPTMTVRGQSIGISIDMLDKLIRMTLGLKRGAPS
jgi:hypothetical protein